MIFTDWADLKKIWEEHKPESKNPPSSENVNILIEKTININHHTASFSSSCGCMLTLFDDFVSSV